MYMREEVEEVNLRRDFATTLFSISVMLIVAAGVLASNHDLKQSLWSSAPTVVSWRPALQQLPQAYMHNDRPSTTGNTAIFPNLKAHAGAMLNHATAAAATADAKPFWMKIPVLGALLGFFASVIGLYSFSAFRKRAAENREIDMRYKASLGPDAMYVGTEVIPGYSGLNGKALVPGKKFPTKQEVLGSIPKELLKKDTFKSMMYALMSLAITGACYYAGTFIPYSWSWAWAWALYGAVTGTVATGVWVLAHECGHDAFSDNRTLQDTVGYLFHTALLVPYFSWQRSHAVHHANTNHMETGETHVPRTPSEKVDLYYTLSKALGPVWPILHSTVVLVIGWPVYLLRGASGGPAYGTTNHFWPYWPFNNGSKELFPGKHKTRVLLSDIGIVAVVAALIAWGRTYGAMYPLLHYGLPYLFTNAWLVGYTWLQHTDVDIPHYDSNEYTWAKGAFHTVDRPYGPVFDFLHHGIGSTHVAHHINSAIPHYNAWKVTEHLKNTYPDLYLYDPTPIHKAVYRVAKNCIAVKKQPGPDGMYVWAKDPTAGDAATEETKAIVQEPVLAAV